jgi:hypothetical protein
VKANEFSLDNGDSSPPFVGTNQHRVAVERVEAEAPMMIRQINGIDHEGNETPSTACSVLRPTIVSKESADAGSIFTRFG